MSLKSRFPEIEAELKPKVDLAVREAAHLIAESAKGRVPVATGRLRASIHVDRQGPLHYSVIAGDADVFYGHMVEHGTTNTPARPFMVPAVEEHRTTAVALVGKALRSL